MDWQVVNNLMAHFRLYFYFHLVEKKGKYLCLRKEEAGRGKGEGDGDVERGGENQGEGREEEGQDSR